MTHCCQYLPFYKYDDELTSEQILNTSSHNLITMNFPAELKYTKDHEWIRIEGTTATVGITDFAQSELGDIVYVDIDVEGETFEREEVFGNVEAVKTVSDLYMPVSGTIIAINEALDDASESVNSDPYGEGWMIKIEMSNPQEVNDLLDAEAYQGTINA